MKKLILLACCYLSACSLLAQVSGNLPSSLILQEMKKLTNTSSVLYIGTTPEDANWQLLSYLANERHLRVGYLSLTRGESLKNSIADDGGIDLGLIHTQEMLAAAKECGVECFADKAYDIGFVKSAEDAFALWKKEDLVEDVSNIIRWFQPDVIITHWDTSAANGRDAALGAIVREAYTAAAVTNPDQSQYYATWKAKRLLWNVPADDSLTNDVVQLPVSGFSSLPGESHYSTAVKSRLWQKTSGFSYIYAPETPVESLKLIDGDSFSNDILAGVDTSWQRYKTDLDFALLTDSLIRNYDVMQPQKSLSLLSFLYNTMQRQPGLMQSNYYLSQLKKIIFACSAVEVKALANQPYAVQGDSCEVTLSVTHAKEDSLLLTGARIDMFDTSLRVPAFTSTQTITTTFNDKVTQPYWLAESMDNPYMYRTGNAAGARRPENTPPYRAQFFFDLEGTKFNIEVPVEYEQTDPLFTKQVEVVTIISPIIVSSKPNIILTDVSTTAGKAVLNDSLVKIQFKSNFSSDSIPVNIRVAQPPIRIALGDSIITRKEEIFLYEKDTLMNLTAGDVYNIALPTEMLQLKQKNIEGNVIASVAVKKDNVIRRYSSNLRVIDYGYIPPVSYYYADYVAVIKDKIKTGGLLRIGYFNKYYDNLCEGLNRLGFDVNLLSYGDAFSDSLSRADVVFVKNRSDLSDSALMRRLFAYVNTGGHLVIDLPAADSIITPYGWASLSIKYLAQQNSDLPRTIINNGLFSSPNKMSNADFSGWRKNYSTVQITADSSMTNLLSFIPTDKTNAGSSLASIRYGKGTILYSGLTLGYQLSSGVAGAYKLLANMMALLTPAGKP